jgi:beta-N-acetylhexosaminidase
MRQPAPRSRHAAPSHLAPWPALSRRGPVGLLAAVALVLAAAVVAITLAGHGDPSGPGTAFGSSGGPAKPAPAKPAPDPAATASTTSARPVLTPAQLAGQRVIYSYSGLTPPASLLNWIRHGEVGGVIFFGPNISSDSQLAHAVAELDAANASDQNPLHSYPLLLMTDQEGGLVRRLPGAPDLSERQIGESAGPATQAQAAGTGAATNLAGVGMNVNLAPVLDVYRTPGDFDDQFGRSYSTSPQQAADLGARFIKAQQALHVAATAKHFPGLGAAAQSQNTDLGPVTLNLSLDTLRGVDEYPFKTAIAAGVKLVMLSWAVYPALSGQLPAGLSPAVVQGELRDRLGFRGVTITDALEAGALRPFGTIAHRATLAASAGMDLILCSAQNPGEGEQARQALEEGYRTGKLGQTAFEAAVQRIATLRSSLTHRA